MSSEVTNESLGQLCRDVSRMRLEMHSRLEGITVAPVSDDIDSKETVRQWLSVIFVSSHVVKIGFRSYFYHDHAAYFTSNALGLPPNEEVPRDKVEDFIKEFCNLAAGAIKEVFEKSGMKSLISLPMLTRSQDSSFFEKNPAMKDNLAIEDSWDLVLDDRRISCKTLFEVFDEERFKKIILPAFGAEDDCDGDIEFF